MKAVKVNERDIQRYVFKKCYYIIVPGEEINSGDTVVATSNEGIYGFHVTDVLQINSGFYGYAVCTVDEFKVLT